MTSQERAQQQYRNAIRTSFRNRHDRSQWGAHVEEIRRLRKIAVQLGCPDDTLQGILDEEIAAHAEAHGED